MRDDTFKWFPYVANKLDFTPNAARVIRFGFRLEDEATANPSPKIGADVLKQVFDSGDAQVIQVSESQIIFRARTDNVIKRIFIFDLK